MTEPAPRHVALAQVLNLGLVCNALDGGVSILGAGLIAGGVSAAPLGVFSGLNMLAQTALLLVVSAYPALPHRVFVPYFLGLLWVGLGLLPLPIYLPDMVWLSALGGGLQIGLTAAAARTWSRDPRSGGRWRFQADLFAESGPSLWYATAYHGVLVAILVIGVPAFLFANASLAISHYTAGFAKLTWWGVEMSERRYARGDDQAILLATIHIADASFYEHLSPMLESRDYDVLLEGVTDDQRLLPRFDYGGIADRTGLTSQGDGVRPGTGNPSDVDVSDFSEPTLDILRAITLLLEGDPLAYLNEISTRAHDLDALEAALKRDLLDMRNEHVLGVMDAVMTDPDHGVAVLPWGALHMPGLEAGLLERGFALESERSLEAIRWAGD